VEQRTELTNRIAMAIKAHGVGVVEIEMRPGEDSDLIRLQNDQYLGIDYEYFERNGNICVSLNTSMPVGGDTLDADWEIQAATIDKLGHELALMN
jgi:hypothetical protein